MPSYPHCIVLIDIRLDEKNNVKVESDSRRSNDRQREIGIDMSVHMRPLTGLKKSGQNIIQCIFFGGRKIHPNVDVHQF